MSNKQLFYHRAVILWTSTEDVSEEAKARFEKMKLPKLVKGSVEVETCDAEPGDPADLM